jgi:hypothetical protein
MDSRKKDESPERLREVALARRFGEALDRLSPSRGECPDAELIAAYHERAIGAEEIAECENHFAACPRCRKILAVLAASADVPLADKEVARLGELASPLQPGSVPPPAVRARPSWHFEWRRWLAPALAAAAVLTVWAVMRGPWQQHQSPASVMVAEAPKTAPEAIPAAPSRGLREQPQPNRLENTPPAKELKDQSAVTAASSKKTRAESGKATAGGDSAAIATDELQAGHAEKTLRSQAVLSGGARANVGANREALAPAGPAAPHTPSPSPQTSAKQEVIATAEAPAINTPASARQALSAREDKAQVPLNGRNYSVMLLAPAESGVRALAKSPSARLLWRAGNAGRIEHSSDGGKTWSPEASPSQEDWLAGAAISDSVCWLAGRNGAIARTTDGEHWERIPPPAMAADARGKLPDWVAVAASDAQIATVTAADNRRFTTHDGGKTWQSQ